jgi:hypothetical protein
MCDQFQGAHRVVLICSLVGFASWHDGPASRLQRLQERSVGSGRPRTFFAGGCDQPVMPAACCLLFHSAACCMFRLARCLRAVVLNGVSLGMLCASVAGTQAEPKRNPSGTQAEPNPEPNRNPTGTQPEPRRNPTGTQPEPNRNPTGAQPEPNRNPSGHMRNPRGT